MRKFLLSTLFFMLLPAFCPGQESIKTYLDYGKVKTYGSAPVETINKVGELYSFSCDITAWPAIIGEDITVNIASLTFPEIVAKGAAPNKYFQAKLKERITQILAPKDKPVKIELRNIKRAETFAIIADVMIDGQPIADMLIAEGLAAKMLDKKVLSENGSASEQSLVASKDSKVYHTAACRFAKSMDPAKTLSFTSSQEAQQSGRRPCKTCKP